MIIIDVKCKRLERIREHNAEYHLSRNKFFAHKCMRLHQMLRVRGMVPHAGIPFTVYEDLASDWHYAANFRHRRPHPESYDRNKILIKIAEW